ncbi:flagellin lysine-N-methylase [Sporosarcina sp. E16_8]|uniref:flagellin lysine-N-methylase n=1 Tax=Sporosarcina sp. E16_8 TaxID=2789295 RepID=UPI001A930570|nr:flagellin lysine-N-methylase [Sporosarcina sp. E16_8]MBO0589101.1 flagellin lysine-N-methylase [Sporosarcina sp. E16_8]
MVEKTREIILPEYMSQFQCIGSACEDTCCAGWRVTVDKETYKKYKDTRNPEMKTLLNENVKRNRSGNSDESYAKIKMDNSGDCTLLDEDHLCKIQKELGHEFLSNTCAVYPRNLNLVDNVVEKSATLSCPEVARLVLLNEKGIDFIQDVEPSDTKGFLKKNSMSKEQQELFWNLRIFTIKILQNRGFSIEDRLIILGLFYRKFDGLKSGGKSEKALSLMQEFEIGIDNGSLSDSIKQLPGNISFQVSMCKSLLEHRLTSPISSQRYVECFNEMAEGLGINSEYVEDEVIQRYKDAYEMAYKPFIDNHEYILENYLVNYVFTNLFPFDKKTITDSFAMLIINFSMIKLHLIGMAKYHKGLNNDLVIKLVQSYSKTIDHNNAYLKNVENLLREHGYTTLAHMVVLVKS